MHLFYFVDKYVFYGIIKSNIKQKDKTTMRVSNVKVSDLEESIKASKYPMSISPDSCTTEITNTAKALAQSGKGEGHDQFLTGITVSFDLQCSNKMWVEMERYRFVSFVSSQSTMHRITRFNIREQCNGYVDDVIIKRLEELQEEAIADPANEEKRLKLLYNIPSGFELTARLTTNYRALKTVYAQRHNHRLPEWRAFCKFIELLPEAKNLIVPKKEQEQEKGN